jgi:hypothetical protein
MRPHHNRNATRAAGVGCPDDRLAPLQIAKERTGTWVFAQLA